MSKKSLLIGVLLALALAAIYWFGFRTDPKVEALNQAIQQQGSYDLRHYPYPYRVMRMDGTVAVMGSPRSAAMPVVQMIRSIDPSLEGADADNPDFVAAEKKMADLQFEARKIVLAQPGVSSVTFKLDKEWLSDHGISVD